MWLKLSKIIKFLKKNIKANKYLLLILVLATAFRFVNLSQPQAYIFDEVYHAFTAREYLNGNIDAWEWWTTPPEGVAYEWTHPPLAKYGMVLGMKLFGENSLGWRFGSGIMGVLSILGIYGLVFALTKNKNVSLISSLIVSIEGLHISQSRIAMNDMYMLFFYIWSLYMAVNSRWKSASILYGLSLASKWSALYGVIPLAYIYLNQNNPLNWNIKSAIYHIFQSIRYLFISISVYVLCFAPFILSGHSWAQWWELHRQMWYYHTHLVATHGYQSVPLQWIFDARPVWYYVKYFAEASSNIYALGNPAILWVGLIALVLQFKKYVKYPYSLLLMLYLVFTLPWIFSPRIMFFYHYLPSSVFLCILTATWVSELNKDVRTLILVFFALTLLLISPMIFGFETSKHYWDTLFFLIPSWK